MRGLTGQLLSQSKYFSTQNKIELKSVVLDNSNSRQPWTTKGSKHNRGKVLLIPTSVLAQAKGIFPAKVPLNSPVVTGPLSKAFFPCFVFFLVILCFRSYLLNIHVR